MAQKVEFGWVKRTQVSSHGWFGFIVPEERACDGDVQFHSRNHAKLVAGTGDEPIMEVRDKADTIEMLIAGTDVVFIRTDGTGGGKALLWVTEDEWATKLAELGKNDPPKD